jgi:hypothetical protein
LESKKHRIVSLDRDHMIKEIKKWKKINKEMELEKTEPAYDPSETYNIPVHSEGDDECYECEDRKYNE